MPSAACPVCGLKVRTVVPRGGDGSALVYVRHLSSRGVTNCLGSRSVVRDREQVPNGGSDS